MISFPSRCGALALVLAAGFLSGADAQTPTATEMTHTDAKGRHLAPRDTFYMLDYVSARTDKGVEGFEPGAEVHFVSANREAHTLTVTDGHAQVEVPPDKLTNDMDIAALVRAKDQANQARIAAYQQAEAKAYQEYEKQAADYTAKDLEKRQQEQRDAQTRAQAQSNATADQSSQQVNASASNNNNNNGYYDEGGFGFGSPYGYFSNTSPVGKKVIGASETVSGKGTVPSSQSGGQSGSRQTGTTSGGGGQSSGGKP